MPRGSIRPKPSHGDDAWEIQASAGTDQLTGRRRRHTRLVRGTKEDAERALTKLLAEIDEAPQATEGTVAHLLEEWYAVRLPTWSPKTAHGYRRIIDTRLIPDLGDVRLRDLRLEQLERYYAGLRRGDGRRRRPLKERSVRNIHAVLRASLTLASKWGWIPANPALGVDIATDPEPAQINPPSTMELRRLVEHIDTTNPELATLILLAADTGMRRGELCGLRWSAINLDRGELIVRRSVVQVDGELHDRATTKGKRKRDLDLADRTVERLRAHLAQMGRRAELGAVKLRPNAYVFSNALDGSTSWRPDSVTQSFRRARDRVELDGVRLHDVRHYMATQWLGEGVDVVTVSLRMGHAKTSTTTDVYGHGTRERQREAAHRVGSLLDY